MSPSDHPPALQVHADDRWGRACLAYNVQIPVTGDAAQAFADAQARLDTLLTGVRPIPADALHISVYTVIPVSWESAAKEQHWQTLSGRVLTLLQHSCEQARAFQLPFDKLRVDPLAVIALAAHSHPFIDKLRHTLAELLAPTNIPHPTYTIVHSTLARFSQPALLSPTVLAPIEKVALRANVHVTTTRLVRERIYPSLTADTLAEHQLQP